MLGEMTVRSVPGEPLDAILTIEDVDLSSTTSMVRVAPPGTYLREGVAWPEQVQDLTPTPMTLSSVMFRTGMNPYTGEHLYVARNQEDKRRQKSYFFNENGSSTPHGRAAAGGTSRGPARQGAARPKNSGAKAQARGMSGRHAETGKSGKRH